MYLHRQTCVFISKWNLGNPSNKLGNVQILCMCRCMLWWVRDSARCIKHVRIVHTSTCYMPFIPIILAMRRQYRLHGTCMIILIQLHVKLHVNIVTCQTLFALNLHRAQSSFRYCSNRRTVLQCDTSKVLIQFSVPCVCVCVPCTLNAIVDVHRNEGWSTICLRSWVRHKKL